MPMFSTIKRNCDYLAASFAAVYRIVDSPRVSWRIAIGLLAIHTALLAYSAYVHSPTLNEPGHLVAGLSHWRFGRFELYRVNPPLVRMVAALPVMVVGYEEDWSGFFDGPGARPVFGMGEGFVAANGARSFLVFMIARWACIPFSWLGAIVCFLWARDLFGRPAGVMACAIWCFEPNILAHASLMTPDAHAAALGAAACYTFWRWLRKPTWAQAALTGIVLGLAELAKTTLLLFYPLWPLMWVAYRWPDRHGMNSRDWFREAGMLMVRMGIGLYVLNLGYGFEGTGMSLQKFHFVSNLFTDNLELEPDLTCQSATSNPRSANRFAGSWLGSVPVPFPQNYVLGIDIQQKDFENYGRPSYLRGEWRETGWWYYYLYAALVKVPLALWLLGFFAVARAIARGGAIRGAGQIHQDVDGSPTPSRGASLRDMCVLLIPAAVIFVVVSSKTGFSEHFRYVLPCFPMLFVWLSGILREKACQPSVNTLERA
jgi:4-amino-4-deoxy-L-arabinose transferase-like glycosyltransferase